MIQFRKDHPILRRNLESSHTGYPFTSIHGVNPNEPDYGTDSHMICVMFAGYDPEMRREDLVYLAVNTYWEPLSLTLPPFSDKRLSWKIAVNTGDPGQNFFQKEKMPDAKGSILIKERSVIIFSAGGISMI